MQRLQQQGLAELVVNTFVTQSGFCRIVPKYLRVPLDPGPGDFLTLPHANPDQERRFSQFLLNAESFFVVTTSFVIDVNFISSRVNIRQVKHPTPNLPHRYRRGGVSSPPVSCIRSIIALNLSMIGSISFYHRTSDNCVDENIGGSAVAISLCVMF